MGGGYQLNNNRKNDSDETDFSLYFFVLIDYISFFFVLLYIAGFYNPSIVDKYKIKNHVTSIIGK